MRILKQIVFFIRMKIKRLLSVLYLDKKPKKSYSQMGEDLIIKSYFDSIHVPTPSYIDMGAYDPFILSNTALFYELGSKGINIEPNPFRFRKFLKYRRRDINLNIGIGTDNGQLDYYVMSSSVLNTFSVEQAKEYVSKWDYQILNILPIQVRTLSWVIQNYYQGKFPDLLSIDIEGLEEEVVHEMEKINSLPSVICIETLSFAKDSSGVKRRDLLDTLMSLGFEIYADTHLNTILVNTTPSKLK